MYSFGGSESGGGTPRFLGANPFDETYLSIIEPELESVIGSEKRLEDLRFCAGLKSSFLCFLEVPMVVPSAEWARLLSVDDIEHEDLNVFELC